jgi:hypothetical protein
VVEDIGIEDSRTPIVIAPVDFILSIVALADKTFVAPKNNVVAIK